MTAPPPGRPKNDGHDAERLAEAKAKRERKALKRLRDGVKSSPLR